MIYDAYITIDKERLDKNMGMGTSVCYEDVVDIKTVKKFCPKEYKNFLKVLKTQKVDLEDFASQYQVNEIENKNCQKAWNELCNAFADATTTLLGSTAESYLILGIGFHDKSEDGDKYDEVDGVFFTVDGVYGLTPAGKKFNKFIDRKFYTKFG